MKKQYIKPTLKVKEITEQESLLAAFSGEDNAVLDIKSTPVTEYDSKQRNPIWDDGEW